MTENEVDEFYMQRCLDLASIARGETYPNPMVGSIIVHGGRIIGEGFHLKSGMPHGEVVAVNTVKDKSLLKSSTLYVNLEPCSHYGKTPPCAAMIAKLGIPRVVIGARDTSGKVSGKGIDIMKKEGVEVIEGILEGKCRDLNKAFYTFHEHKRPYVVLKWAQTRDGFIDVSRKKDHPIEPTWITNELSKTLVHKWRTEIPSILVGTRTVQQDNPGLTARNWKGENPVRLIIDEKNSLEDSFKVFDEGTFYYRVVDKKYGKSKKNEIKLDFGRNFVVNLLHELYALEIQVVLIEGGSETLTSFIQSGFWDEARVFVGDALFREGVIAPEFNAIYQQKEVFGNSELNVYRNSDTQSL